MRQLTWQAVGLIAVLAAAAITLATVAHWDSTSIAAILAILGGIGGGAAVAGGMSGRVDAIAAETTAQTRTLQVIDQRTNGELDRRIEDGARSAASIVLAELREQGVIR